jgi:hypothetical protein
VAWRGGTPGAVVLLWALAAPAHADPDFRPTDRFFYSVGIGGGAAQGVDVGAPAFAYQTSWMPNDYLAVGLAVDIFGVPATAQTPSALNIDLGWPVVGAVPLRYVQPYAGLWLGLHTTRVNQFSPDGVTAGVHPLAGFNVYVSRKVRLFVQWESVPVDLPAGMSDTRANLLTVGGRCSPDRLHRASSVGKFDAVWTPAAGTIALWGVFQFFSMIGRSSS